MSSASSDRAGKSRGIHAVVRFLQEPRPVNSVKASVIAGVVLLGCVTQPIEDAPDAARPDASVGAAGAIGGGGSGGAAGAIDGAGSGGAGGSGAGGIAGASGTGAAGTTTPCWGRADNTMVQANPDCFSCPGSRCEAGFRCEAGYHFNGPVSRECACVNGLLECCDLNGLFPGCFYLDGEKPPCPAELPIDGSSCGPGPNLCAYPHMQAVCNGVGWSISNVDFCNDVRHSGEFCGFAVGLRCPADATNEQPCRCGPATNDAGAATSTWTCGPDL